MSKPRKELYEFSSFTLDVSERLLLRSGTRISLTDKAFDTLCILVRRSGELISKDQLMNEVWADSIVEENNLDQKISKLRQVLGERKGKEKFIETVRGHGYRFLPDVRRVEPAPAEPEESFDLNVSSPASDSVSADEFSTSPVTHSPPAARHHETRRTGNVFAVAEWRQEAEETEIAEHREANKSEPIEESAFFGGSKQKKWPGALIASVLVIIAVGAFALFRLSPDRSHVNNTPIDSIAVLPFENAAQDANAEYLSDGITESLINRLSQLSNLKVMSSSSVSRYKGATQDMQKIGNELNVRAILSGSVKEIGDQIVINVSLDDVSDGRHIWGEQYERKFADVLAIQSEIVKEVSGNLRIKLSEADQRQLAKRYTDNSEAYQLYLKGMYKWRKHTLEDLQQGIAYFNQALEKDPNYALAYSGLSASYGVLGNAYLRPDENFPKAKAYAAKALAIDDSLAEAHLAMGAVTMFYDWDWAESEKEQKRAQALNPNNADAFQLNAVYLEAMGRFNEAMAEARHAEELEPQSAMFVSEVGIILYFDHRYDEAIAQFEKTIALEPRYVEAYVYLAEAYEQKKMYAEAIATYEKGILKAERHPTLVAGLGRSYGLAGERAKAEKALDELQAMSKQRYISPYLFAVVYSGMGEEDQVMAWLDKAYQDRSYSLIFLSAEPMFDRSHTDPRFRDLVRRIGLPS